MMQIAVLIFVSIISFLIFRQWRKTSQLDDVNNEIDSIKVDQIVAQQKTVLSKEKAKLNKLEKDND